MMDYSLPKPEQRQLLQAFLHLDQLQGGEPELPGSLAQLRATCRATWVKAMQAQPSLVQKQVLRAVQQLPGCSGAVGERLTDDGLFSMDIGVELASGEKLAIEVDGPSHFLQHSSPAQLDGATRLRNRLLQARGWRVVSVPVVQGWAEVAHQGSTVQQAYLQQLLGQPSDQARTRSETVVVHQRTVTPAEKGPHPKVTDPAPAAVPSRAISSSAKRRMRRRDAAQKQQQGKQDQAQDRTRHQGQGKDQGRGAIITTKKPHTSRACNKDQVMLQRYMPAVAAALAFIAAAAVVVLWGVLLWVVGGGLAMGDAAAM